MMKSQIREYYLIHKNIFDENFRLVVELFDKEAIHKMRTTTKRLRALFLLISYLTEHKFKPKKQLKKIRNLFKLAGWIRELQIEQEIVRNYQTLLKESYPEYLEYLRTREFREISRFLKQLPMISKRDRVLRDDKILGAIEAIPGSQITQNCRQFINEKVSEIISTLSKPASNHRIHYIRTLLKQLYYISDIESLRPCVTEITGMDVERIREIEQYLGSWHDLVNSSRYLENFFKVKPLKNQPKYQQLKQQVRIDRKEMRKVILKQYFKELPADKK